MNRWKNTLFHGVYGIVFLPNYTYLELLFISHSCYFKSIMPRNSKTSVKNACGKFEIFTQTSHTQIRCCSNPGKQERLKVSGGNWGLKKVPVTGRQTVIELPGEEKQLFFGEAEVFPNGLQHGIHNQLHRMGKGRVGQFIHHHQE